MEKGIIYRYLNIESGKSYVGQTLHPDKRFYQHLNSKNRDWHVDYQKNPWKYEYSVVEDNIPVELLDEREIYWISYFDSFRNGYNCTEGGCGVRGLYGDKNPFYGKHHSEETKKKLSELHKGKSTWIKGKHLYDETKKKLSELHKGLWCGDKNPFYGVHRYGDKNPFYGKHHSEETKQKKRKPIIQYSKSGEFIKEWSSLSEAAEYLNFKSIGNISQCLKGINKTAYGYVWKYKNE